MGIPLILIYQHEFSALYETCISAWDELSVVCRLLERRVGKTYSIGNCLEFEGIMGGWARAYLL